MEYAHYLEAEKLAMLSELLKSEDSLAVFSKRLGIPEATMYSWILRYGYYDRYKDQRKKGTIRAHPKSKRKQVLDFYKESESTVRETAKHFNLSAGTISPWITQFRRKNNITTRKRGKNSPARRKNNITTRQRGKNSPAFKNPVEIKKDKNKGLKRLEELYSSEAFIISMYIVTFIKNLMFIFLFVYFLVNWKW